MLKKSFLILITILINLCLVSTLVLGDALNIAVKRLAGSDRYGTCEEISKFGWPGASGYAIITTGQDFPDALSAAPFAKKYNAPIIITEKDSLNSKAASELTRLKVNKVFIMGGTGAVSQNVEDQIKSMKISTIRISGADRYETSAKIAQNMDPSNGVVLVSGDDYPGALFMAPIAAKKGIPILLVQKDSMPDSVKSYLNGKKVPKYYVIGGEDVISSNTVKGLSPVTRILGRDKYERNLAAINAFSGDLDFSNVYIATGEDFPDALSGSAMAAMTNSPIILMVNRTLSDNARSIINSNISKVKNIYLLGGESVVANISMTPAGIAAPGDTNTPPAATPGTAGSQQIAGAGNTNGNISNDGYAATDGNYIYYTPSSGGYGLWRMNMDGTQNILLSYDTPRYINVYNGWVFYSNQNDNGYIYRISTDGTGRSLLIKNSSSYINVLDGYLYYSNDSDGGKLYKISTDGSNKIKLNEDKSKFINVVDKNIYYSNISNNGYIYKINTDGTLRKQLNYSYSTYLVIQNGYIYYINKYEDGDIYKLDINGTNKLKLHVLQSNERGMLSLNLGNNALYFKVKDSSGNIHLYSTDYNLSGRTLLPLSSTNNTTLISGNVFFK